MMTTRSNRSRRRRAFTLVEMLVVMAVIVLLATLITPAVNGITKGSALTQASQVVLGQFATARQLATTRNQTIELRFISAPDPDGIIPSSDQDDGSWRMRGMQIYARSLQGAYTPITKVEWMPTGIIMDGGKPDKAKSDPNSLSTLFSESDDATKVMTSPTVVLPRVGKKYSYYFIRFRPDGSTNLNPASNKTWFLTLRATGNLESLATPPPNFFTIEVDAVQGTTRVFRPQ